MKLLQLLKNESLVPDLESEKKEDVLKELLSHGDLSTENFRREDILAALLEREHEQSTGLGEGMAFPHARLSGLNKIHILIGISQKGIDYDSVDKKPVNFIVMTLVDHARPNELLKTRAAIVKLLTDKVARSRMLRAESSDELLEIISSYDISVDYEITAKDIMRSSKSYIDPESTINDAARELHRNHIDSLPVVDENKVFYGEISCYDLFSYGLPDFFNNLHVISFVKHMDPFEKYFNVDRTAKVSVLLETKDKSDLIISAEATLMEIIFEMTVKHKEFLYVVSDDGKLRGILDRYSIIDKIIIAR